MGKETILVTGSNGLLGQKLTDLYLQKEHIQLIATGKGLNRHPSKEGYVYQEMDINATAILLAIVLVGMSNQIVIIFFLLDNTTAVWAVVNSFVID